jgi:CHAT domain-containing protein/tetratricopeptide (TPR) repeat protein
MQNLSRRAFPALVSVGLWLLAAPIAIWAQQDAPPKDQAQEFQNTLKDLFGDLGPLIVPDKAGNTSDGKKQSGDGNPFGGLLEGLLDAQRQGGKQDCQSFLSLTSMQDTLKPLGTEANREKLKKFLDLHVTAVQAMIRQDWEEHLRIGHEALEVEAGIGEWPSAQPRGLLVGVHWMNLGNAYVSRQQGHKAENLENSINAAQKALDLMPKEGPCADQRHAAHVNLATMYTQRIRGEKAENLELAIASLETASQTISREALPQMWAIVQNTLGLTYLNRIRGRTKENQERAIQAYHAALQVWDQQSYPEQWGMVQSNLGSAYIQRVSGNPAENIELAISALEASLKARKPGTKDEKPAPIEAVKDPAADQSPVPELMTALKNAQELLTILDKSEAGTAQIIDPAAFPIAYQNLGVAYHKRIRGDRAENIERAIAAHDMVLTFWTRDTNADRWAAVQHNLGESLALRAKGDRAANIDRAIQTFRSALSVRTTESFPRGHLSTATALGQALSAKGDWEGALEAFDTARASFRVLFGQGLNEAEARDLLQEAGPLFTDAAFAAAANGDVERAFALLEEGKARLLAVALKLDRLPGSAADRKRLDELRRQIREGEAAYEASQGEARAASIARLRQLRVDLLTLVDAAEGKVEAGQAKELAAAAEALPENGALIAPIVSDAGASAIVVMRRQGRVAVEAVALPGLDRSRLTALLGARDQGGWLGAYGIHYLDPASQAKRLPEWFKAIEEAGDELGRLIGAPLTNALAARGVGPGAQLTILPVGPLGLLPLGLARHPATGRSLMEDYTVNFAPSLAALVSAKRRASKTEREPGLAVIANPTGDLPYTELEGALVASRFAASGRHALTEKQATSEAVLAGLKGRDYWHFSSHGFFDWDEPRASGLLMAARKPLTVGALMDASDMGAPRLAVLSACETGLYDIVTAPNEFTGLPAAFMRLGAGGVLATLWPVNDLSTALLIARFYDLHRGEKLAPAAALRSAQSWLRDAKEAELKAYLRAAAEEGRLPRDFLHNIDQIMRNVKAQAGSDKPFAHPYYWSGFTLTGL